MKEKVRISSILDDFTNPIKHDYGLKAEFDLVIFNKINNLPILVVELNGREHQLNNKVIHRDKLKNEICKDNNINLIQIENDYSRRYYYIKNLLFEFLKS